MGFGGGSSSSQETQAVAVRPTRYVDTEAEDIVLGDVEEEENTSSLTKGKRGLTKPTGGTTSGLSV